MNLLARRDHSEAELVRKCLVRGFDKAEIVPVIQKLAQEGLLNNTRFVENYIHYRKNKGYGPLRIRMELLERGIAEELIEQYLDNHANTWQDQAYQAWQKRFKKQMPQDVKTYAKHMRFLQQRGFALTHLSFLRTPSM